MRSAVEFRWPAEGCFPTYLENILGATVWRRRHGGVGLEQSCRPLSILPDALWSLRIEVAGQAGDAMAMSFALAVWKVESMGPYCSGIRKIRVGWAKPLPEQNFTERNI